MKLRQPWLIKVVALLGAWIIRFWIGTLYFRKFNLDEPVDEHPPNARHKRFLYAIFHEGILLPCVIRTKIHVLISEHHDGELIARVCRHLGFDVVRGSTSKGGAKALRQLMKVKDTSHLMVTPDGPRGPRRKVQLGTIFLASKTGVPIIPVGIAYDKCWRASSWDRFAVPCPWMSGYFVTGKAITVPRRLKRDQMEAYRQLVEERMLEVTALAETWAATGKRPLQPPKDASHESLAA